MIRLFVIPSNQSGSSSVRFASDKNPEAPRVEMKTTQKHSKAELVEFFFQPSGKLT